MEGDAPMVEEGTEFPQMLEIQGPITCSQLQIGGGPPITCCMAQLIQYDSEGQTFPASIRFHRIGKMVGLQFSEVFQMGTVEEIPADFRPASDVSFVVPNYGTSKSLSTITISSKGRIDLHNEAGGVGVTGGAAVSYLTI